MTYSPSRQMMATGNLFADSFRYGLERYGSNRNRHWWGITHRQWLLNSGRYIKTSEQRGMGLMQFIAGPLPEYKPIGEGGPELVNFRAGGVIQDPRLIPRPGEHIIHPDGRAWKVRE
ncbi:MULTISPECIES: hypothetical protein [unclassified Brevibacterium]|uniref:hypothetical protein n=1 Tax=unclassified Brevibacterium TaxID=2614124 RepID=UPI001E5144BA|nr:MULTISPECIES: hypothetical protein [unclassified Brevibacterium]MCD1287321.1 hypothetical protein [Brevibacterium sp. CCUG 69071]MDK8436424.1 hypothetical protein [Brevibacterium sp. H-BE7]